MVFTSYPLLAVRPNVRTVDTGWNGENLVAMRGTPDLWDMFQGVDFFVFIIGYDSEDLISKD